MRIARPDIALAATLLAAQLGVIALTPVIVGHDVPQHLAFARLLADADRGTLAAPYAPPLHPDPYFTTYRILGLLFRVTSIDTSTRLVYAAYAILLTLAFFRLARTTNETRRGRVSMAAALGPLLVWNPVACMGFMPFMLAIPFALWAVAGALSLGRHPRNGEVVGFVVAVAVLTALHTAAAAMTFLAIVFIAVARRTRNDLAACASFALTAWLTVRVLGTSDSPSRVRFDDWLTNARAFGVVDGTVGTFVLAFAPPELKAKLALATIAGAFPLEVKCVSLGALVLALAVVFWVRRKAIRSATRRTFAVATMLFVAAAYVVPTSIQVPDDMCLIDFRMYVFAFAFILALLPDAWCARPRAKLAVVAYALVSTVITARAVLGAGAEAADAVALTRQLGPNDRLLALSFHDRSAYFDEENALLHNLAVHHTAATRATTTLFWGRFDLHLPIGYLPGEEPKHPPPWFPEQWTTEDVLAATHVFVSLPDADDDEERRRGAARLLDQDGSTLRRMECRGAFCLFEVVGKRDRQEASR